MEREFTVNTARSAMFCYGEHTKKKSQAGKAHAPRKSVAGAQERVSAMWKNGKIQ
ncbi:hypothetical protein [Cupriavidus basilensis]|uniref:hypothetical protein n=1 Tax=Cupriavidus basilensis TaxID=68895 RepID=UPI0020A68D26|nr:hypothetical protein [Cupriavidus basilensis]MCP3023175.1 hypothetical protein [Cupriavidus basilensis]